MDYTDLCERLRSGTRLPMLADLMREAADAIEEQGKRINRAVDLYNRNIEKTAMYEALVGITPKPPKEEA